MIEILAQERQSFLSGTNVILEDAADMLERLVSINERPPDNLWSEYVTALNNLAASVANGAVRPQALEAAEAVFTKLENHSNGTISALGSYGLSLTAALANDDYRSALTVYRSIEAFPAISSQVFPTEFFSDDYREIIPRNYERLERNISAYQEIASSNRKKRFTTFLTSIVRNLLIAPINFLLAFTGPGGRASAEQKGTGRRGKKQPNKFPDNYAQRMKLFEQWSSAQGWTLHKDVALKEYQLDDQVKRLTVIYKNHLSVIAKDAKLRRRELEAEQRNNFI